MKDNHQKIENPFDPVPNSFIGRVKFHVKAEYKKLFTLKGITCLLTDLCNYLASFLYLYWAIKITDLWEPIVEFINKNSNQLFDAALIYWLMYFVLSPCISIFVYCSVLFLSLPITFISTGTSILYKRLRSHLISYRKK